MNSSSAPTEGPRRSRGVRDRVVSLERVRAGDLEPNPANWRRHPPAQRQALRALLRQVGFADSLIARRDGDRLVLIDGHLRRSLDPDQMVPVQVVDLDEREAEVLLATLDPLAAMATADPEILAGLLERVEASSAAVKELLESLARGAGLPVMRPLVDPDHLPEAPEPRTKPGDLWVLGSHRLVCADATDPRALARLMDGTRADVVWTDPPYGVDYVGKTPRALRIAGDKGPGLRDLLERAFAAAGEVLAPGAAIYVCPRRAPASSRS
jgi:hypothetical protein